MAGNFVRKHVIAALFAPLLLLLVIYPLCAIVANLEWGAVLRILQDSFFWDSVYNTVLAAVCASVLGVVMALGFGYCYIFLRNSWLYKIASFMNELPIALPHTVAGLALLLAFGRAQFGFVGPTGLAFTVIAVTLAMFFGAYPVAARTIASSVDRMDQGLINVARSLGDSPTKTFIRIVVPSLHEAIFSAFLIAFARSLSEFAAAIMFGGNVPGSTQVLASYVFTKVEEGELAMAVAASAFCILLSLFVLLIFARRTRRALH